MSEVRICRRCVMSDKADDTIQFNEEGFCNYCIQAFSEINTTTYFPNEEGNVQLTEMIKKLKEENAGRKYDCVMGISGGLDSSYLAYLGYKWGLRILAVHIDDGFDTDISRKNIEKLCNSAHIELRTITPNPKQYNDLILAYMKAGVPNLAVPQDNILFAFLYDTVKKENLKYFLSGGNFALECILQRGNTFSAMDVKNIKKINSKFGNTDLSELKFISSYRKYLRQKTGKVVTLRPLNYLDYNRERAFKELYDFCGFEYYGSKHLENMLTAFVQLYWLPLKFGVDKRSSHLSSMIVSGQMTRDEALEILERPLYDDKLMERYIKIIKEKLSISDECFEKLVNGKNHMHEEYGYDRFGTFLHKIL